MTKFQKEKEVLKQIAKASEAIRRKHRSLKLGKEAAEKTLSATFNPIVMPLQKLVDISRTPIKPKTDPIKHEVKKEEYDDNASFTTAVDEKDDQIPIDAYDTSSTSPKTPETYEYLTNKFLRMLQQNRKQYLDMTYGVRKLDDGTLMIGDKPIRFEGQYIDVDGKRYLKTVGLMELLFRQAPDQSLISDADLNIYKEILIDTNAYRKHYSPTGPTRTSRSLKYKNYIAKLIPTTRRRSSTGGGSLPKFMIDRKNTNTDYVYWDDPNELVDRLRLLVASQAAGNPSHNNEIISIIEELREAGIIY